jgi:hypothetical protein
MATESDGGAAALPAGDSPVATSGQPEGVAGRGRRGRGRRDPPSSDNVRWNQMKFEGREPSLEGFIYDSTGERSPDQYIKTTKEIINYVGRTYTKYTAEFTQAVHDLKLIDPTPPADPNPMNIIVFELWKLELKEYKVKEQE